MSLTLLPTKNILDGLKLTEHINPVMLQMLINSSIPKPVLNKYTSQFYDNEKKQLEALLSKTKNGLSITKYK